MNGMFATYKKKGYAGLGRLYPVGNDGSIANNGKFAGVYYEINNAQELVTLIGAAEAAADLRADGSVDTDEDTGQYTPATNVTAYSLAPGLASTFAIAPKQGYWFSLFKGCDTPNSYAYDSVASRNHYGLMAIPADYGSSGEATFIINEEGTVFTLDRGTGAYLVNYPSHTPAENNWEIAE